MRYRVDEHSSVASMGTVNAAKKCVSGVYTSHLCRLMAHFRLFFLTPRVLITSQIILFLHFYGCRVFCLTPWCGWCSGLSLGFFYGNVGKSDFSFWCTHISGKTPCALRHMVMPLELNHDVEYCTATIASSSTAPDRSSV